MFFYPSRPSSVQGPFRKVEHEFDQDDPNGHVLFESFGAPQENVETEIDELLESMPEVDSISAKMLLREAYETTYEIYNHNLDNSHPWAMVMAHPKEDMSTYGAIYRTILSYRVRDVYKRYGLNLTEFLDLPREYVEFLLEVSANETKQDTATAEDIAREMDESVKGMK